jgi:RNA polymerase sigma-70 factor (ECF subfamily)
MGSPTTRPSLLVRLRDPRDRAAWEEFAHLYAPVIRGYARRRGLQDADAEDLTQEVLRRLAGAPGGPGYDPGRGPFRAWLFAVVRNEVRKAVSRRRPGDVGAGGTDGGELLAGQPARAEADPDWDAEYQRRVFVCAAAQVRADFRPATWEAFWRTAVEGKSGQVVAVELGLTVAAVYLARGRVMARLKEQVRLLEGD